MTTAPGYLRFPHLVGDRIVFSAEDDIWLGSLGGGPAIRLTADAVPVARPRLSPDGSTVAWLSRRAGEPEVWAMPVAGGPLRQLTYFGSATTSILGFRPDGQLIVHSAAGQPSTSKRWAYAIDLRPGADATPRRLPYGPISGIAWAESGAVLVNTGAFKDAAHWKRYRGGTAGRLWLDRDGSGEFAEFLPELVGQKTMPVAIGDRFAFLSDAEGHGNVYSVAADGSDLRRHTDHDRFYARQLAGDGQRLVYQHAGQVWLLDSLAADAQPRHLELELVSARAGRASRPVAVGAHLGDYTVDATGRATAIEVRGNIVWLTHRNGPARVIASTPGVRYRLPVVLGTGTAPSVGYVSGADGPDAIEIADADGTIGRYGAGEVGRVLELVAAPDGSRLAMASHDGRLLVMSVTDGSITELASNPHGDHSGLAWSPDSAWLAFAADEPTAGLSSIGLIHVADGQRVAVTRERFADSAPVFSQDGKYLAFLSVRTFDPVYDAHVFDLSFAVGSRPFLVTLAADTPSPFDPELAGRPASPDSAERPAGAGADADVTAAADADAGGVRVRLDADGIQARVVPFPVRAGRYADLRAVRNGFVWTDSPIAGQLGEARQPEEDIRPSLQRWDLVAAKQLELAAHIDAAEPSGDGSRLVLRDKGKLIVVPSDHKAADDGDEAVTVDLGRVRLSIEPAAEWAQMLDETGRLMRDHYWIEDMSGVDWDAAVDKYRPLIDQIASRDDLSDLLWELNGETGSSHAYETPPAAEKDPLVQPAFLGADLDRAEDGRWLITRVLESDNSARHARSPLAGPGIAARSGDRLVSVNGRPVGPDGPAPLLLGSADKPVELVLERDGDRRSVVVTPLPNELELRYLDWVAGRRRLVHAASNGRIGYLHVPDMVSSGWAAFHRDLSVEMGRDALIVDTRDNSGGHTSQLVIEKLARSVLAWSTPRHRSRTSYPQQAPRGPLVSLANEWAGSDGDIVNAAFKALGLGPVIGTRTWGGVIGIDGRYQLVDGTRVTQPRYAYWFEAYGWGVENYGVDPDVVVEMPPQAWAAGADPQLQAGIEHLLAELERRGPRPMPQLADRPSRRAPQLGPRPHRG